MSVPRLYWRTLGGQWRGWLVLLGCSALESLPAFLSGRLVQASVDGGFAAGDPVRGVAWLLVFGAVAALGAFGARLVWQRLGTIIEPLRDALVGVVVRGVLRDTTPRRTGPDASGVARITQHVETVRDATAGLLVQARGMVVTTVGALAGVFTVAGTLAWAVAGPVVAALLLFTALLPTLATRQRALALADERTAESAGEVLSGLRDVAACGAEPAAVGQVHTTVDAQATAAVRMATATALRTLVISVGGFLPLLLVLLLAPGRIAAGQLTAGAALGTLVYLSGTLQPALQGLAATASTVVLRLLVALRRLDETGAADHVGAEPTAPAPPDGTVTARGLTHRWGEHAEPVLRDLDLDLVPGDHLAVVGPSGIGKSTLAGLLTGTLAPQRGRVLLGGVPVTRLDPDVRRRLVAFTPQESYLFAGTVRENLALLDPAASDERLLRAAEAVGAGDLVRRLGGLEGRIGHSGAELSAGQRELLALARVYASPARVVVLDEATAHVDAHAEATAERAFAARGGVLVVIAHRLSSALRARRVLVLDGRDTLLGDHEELLRRSARYAELMRAWETVTPPRAAAALPAPPAARR
ncbi:ATP-binding cassette, subfamily C [Amycolatopsis arida]|uniref:ATP-binding cassette, subfamily C n=1 Tax=Amycolatopsis arida TaxID=587909 RepID=A0A1I5SLN9_9PSEU|nr:ABC transporter ATP-binding protein [Amycolatopsis arida]TDX96434.1 ATP-binding cassette subfamily C protein [Amycolatopsis arida]SFP71629.1 ATP-binding cassette, subfamily C [Amycolatopsis arida]